MALRILASFFATFTFGILFNTEKKELLFCGIAGALGWLALELISPYSNTNTLQVFVATVVATTYSRLMAFRRKQPITVYLICGIIPLVPGSGIFYTVYNILMNDTATAYNYGISTIATSGVISLGIMSVLSLPYQMFSWVTKKDNENEQ